MDADEDLKMNMVTCEGLSLSDVIQCDSLSKAVTNVNQNLSIHLDKIEFPPELRWYIKSCKLGC